MAKNKKFKRVYEVVVEGVTTNDSASKFLDTILKSTVTVMDTHFDQVNVSVKEKS